MTLPSHQEILDDIGFFDDWEQRYQYIIDLGKTVPPLLAQYKTEQYLVPGCQSKVWLAGTLKQGILQLQAESDAVIVSGLLALVLAAYHQQTPAQILAFDIDAYFKALDLERHLSPTRGNGLRSIVASIRQLAVASQSAPEIEK